MIGMINRDRLRGLMAERKITQAQLAREIGISLNSLNMKLTGRAAFKEKDIKNIALYLRVTTDFLFY